MRIWNPSEMHLSLAARPSVLSSKHLRSASWHNGGWPQWFRRPSVICSESQSAEPSLVLLNSLLRFCIAVFLCCFLHPLNLWLSRNVYGDASSSWSSCQSHAHSILSHVSVFQMKSSQHSADADSLFFLIIIMMVIYIPGKHLYLCWY